MTATLEEAAQPDEQIEAPSHVAYDDASDMFFVHPEYAALVSSATKIGMVIRNGMPEEGVTLVTSTPDRNGILRMHGAEEEFAVSGLARIFDSYQRKYGPTGEKSVHIKAIMDEFEAAKTHAFRTRIAPKRI